MHSVDRAREAMNAELAAALVERDCQRVEAAAVWLRTTGTPLVDIYETLLQAALRLAPEYPTTAAEQVASFEVQACVRDLLARLAPRQAATSRGTVVVAVPGGSRWILGTTALTHVLADAGFDVVASPELTLEDLPGLLAELEQPVALCLAVHEVSQIPQAREVLRRIRSAQPEVRLVVGGQAHESVSDLAGLLGAHAACRTLRETLQAIGDGTNPLSPRELAVLQCVAQGMSNPDAGQHLGVASATVKTHLDRVYAKLGTSDRTATVALAMRRGWIE